MIKLSRIICIVAALFTTSAVLASESGWIISEANGQVSVMRDDKAIYGAKGTPLQVGDVIRTSKGARAVLARGDEFHIVSPKTQVRIVKVEEDSTATKILKFVGNMLSPDQPRSSLKQPMQAAVVKGYGRGVQQSLVQDPGEGNSASSTSD